MTLKICFGFEKAKISPCICNVVIFFITLSYLHVKHNGVLVLFYSFISLPDTR